MDQGFPVIKYLRGKSPREWGRQHGEFYREGIHVLAGIRRALMAERNPDLDLSEINELANQQWEICKQTAPHIHEELDGIKEGASISIPDLVILNNYTDFRDINFSEEGCSTIAVKSNKGIIAGQTWDMHGSAKDYVSIVHIPKTEKHAEMVLFSVVGCVGMAGVSANNTFVGINNISTKGATVGLMWPVLVRLLLEKKNLAEMSPYLKDSSPCSGHVYLMADNSGAEIWEKTPKVQDCVGKIPGEKFITHTNHCLSTELQAEEISSVRSSTTESRFEIMNRKGGSVKCDKDMELLLKDHEGFPKSICSHYQSNSQDPSKTCGALLSDLSGGSVKFWRGCEEYDSNYKEEIIELREK